MNYELIPDIAINARIYKLERKISSGKMMKYEFKELYEYYGFSKDFINYCWNIYKKKLKSQN